MNKYHPFTILLTFLLSCSTLSTSGYNFSGKVENNKATVIFLEQLSHAAITTIDSAKVLPDGSFSLKGNIESEGLYRLRLGGEAEKYWMVCLGKGAKLTAKLDANNYGNATYSKFVPNDELQELVNVMQKQQVEVGKLEEQYNQMKAAGASQDDLNAIAVQMQGKASVTEEKLRKAIEAPASLIVRYYVFTLYLNAIMQGQAPPEMLAKLNLFIAELNKKMPNSDYNKDFQKIDAQIKQMKAKAEAEGNAEKLTAVGVEAPDFEIPNKDGKKIKLSSLRGKVVLLDFWASWCRPCRMENPNVVSAYSKYKSKGFTVMSVSQDSDKDKWIAAIQQDGLVWESHLSDLQGNQEASAKYGIKYIPTTFLIGKDGKIIAKNLRGEALEEELKKIFGF